MSMVIYAYGLLLEFITEICQQNKGLFFGLQVVVDTRHY